MSDAIIKKLDEVCHLLISLNATFEQVLHAMDDDEPTETVVHVSFNAADHQDAETDLFYGPEAMIDFLQKSFPNADIQLIDLDDEQEYH